MPKLATPVQYEPTLEGLNDIRPLQLADEGKIVIPMPALCQNPPTKDRPAIGRLARCSQQGALLKHRVNDLQTYEIFGGQFNFFDADQHFTYSQKVSSVVCYMGGYHNIVDAYWSSPSYTEKIQDITLTGTTVFCFSGVDLYIHTSFVDVFGYIWLFFLGFY